MLKRDIAILLTVLLLIGSCCACQAQEDPADTANPSETDNNADTNLRERPHLQQGVPQWRGGQRVQRISRIR